ncbi:MAG: hypothetical protein KKF48_00270 [Nanoarchaeota archaeon]|nr:hypothetical protein [Nanoarchaeota archaeon]MBU1027459.1 hypothetical protein [Nanoarchaeota archaeon]
MRNLSNISLKGPECLYGFNKKPEDMIYKCDSIFVAGHPIKKNTTNTIFVNNIGVESLLPNSCSVREFYFKDQDALLLILNEILKKKSLYFFDLKFDETLFRRRQRVYGKLHVLKFEKASQQQI